MGIAASLGVREALDLTRLREARNVVARGASVGL